MPPATPSSPDARHGVGRRVAALLPGLAVVVGAVAVAQGLSTLVDAVSAIVVGIVIGILLGNSGKLPASTEAGMAFAATPLLRLGIVLIGFRLALGDLFAFGAQGLVVVVTVVATTFFMTLWIGARLRLSSDLSLLTATGYAICGATAIAAMREVIDADEDDTAFAIALVTLFGTLSILVLPLAATATGMEEAAFGQWVGAGVHDVGQVVAAAATGGSTALTVAVVVKLTRVLMLGPMIAVIGLVWRKRLRETEAQPETGQRRKTPPLVPLFVVGFLAAVAIRSTGVLPDGWLDVIQLVGSLVLTGALVGLGSSVRMSRLRVIGMPGVLLGFLAWLFVAVVAYGGVLAVQQWG